LYDLSREAFLLKDIKESNWVYYIIRPSYIKWEEGRNVFRWYLNYIYLFSKEFKRYFGGPFRTSSYLYI
jgi:hypothetical protein